jgi:chlorophyll/bacteriochlorophyll a synthase
MHKAINLLRLYRADAAIITFFSYVFGVYLAGGHFTWPLVLPAVLVSLISVNFIYSINAWFDRHIDAVNKPHRVLPGGSLSPQSVRAYVTVLGLFSLAYPFILKAGTRAIILLWIFPLLGVLYSNPWFPFKKISVLSVLTTSLILTLPAVVALQMASALQAGHIIIVSVIFAYCLFTVPLKDIEDIKGDTQYGSQNWANTAGTFKLVKICGAAQALLGLAAFLIVPRPLHLFLAGMCWVSCLVIMTFLIFNINITRLYRTVIKTMIVCGIIFFLLTLVLKLV